VFGSRCSDLLDVAERAKFLFGCCIHCQSVDALFLDAFPERLPPGVHYRPKRCEQGRGSPRIDRQRRGFARVGRRVERFDSANVEVVNQLAVPVAKSDLRVEAVVTVQFGQGPSVPLRPVAVGDCREVFSFDAAWRLCAGKRQNRRHDVGYAGFHLDDGRRRALARHINDHRDAYDLVVQGAVMPLASVFEEFIAVVSGYHDHGVGGDAQAVQTFAQFQDVVVDEPNLSVVQRQYVFEVSAVHVAVYIVAKVEVGSVHFSRVVRVEHGVVR